MLSLLTVLEFRKLLKRYMNEEAVIALQLIGCEGTPIARVNTLGWFTVTFDVLDSDEETWLGTETVAISQIFAINESSVERVRTRLIFENTPHSELEAMRAAHAAHGDDHGYEEDDEDDYQ